MCVCEMDRCPWIGEPRVQSGLDGAQQVGAEDAGSAVVVTLAPRVFAAVIATGHPGDIQRLSSSYRQLRLYALSFRTDETRAV